MGCVVDNRAKRRRCQAEETADLRYCAFCYGLILYASGSLALSFLAERLLAGNSVDTHPGSAKEPECFRISLYDFMMPQRVAPCMCKNDTRSVSLAQLSRVRNGKETKLLCPYGAVRACEMHLCRSLVRLALMRILLVVEP